MKKIKTCIICNDKFTKLKCNKCSLECCSECINIWYEQHRSCPQCRQSETFNITKPVLPYSFGLATNDHQPSGVIPFSRINNIRLAYMPSEAYTYGAQDAYLTS